MIFCYNNRKATMMSFTTSLGTKTKLQVDTEQLYKEDILSVLRKANTPQISTEKRNPKPGQWATQKKMSLFTLPSSDFYFRKKNVSQLPMTHIIPKAQESHMKNYKSKTKQTSKTESFRIEIK